MDATHKVCSNCESEYIIDKLYSETIEDANFCPFCAEPLDLGEIDE
jgi:hypothetical protein